MANNIYLRFMSQRILLSLVFVSCMLALLGSFRSLPSKESITTFQPQHTTTLLLTSKSEAEAGHVTSSHSKSNARCDLFEDLLNDILIVVKTGANEVLNKLPTQLLTGLKCYKDLLIFSDLEQEIGHYKIHDALDNVTESVKASSKEFAYYRTLQQNSKDLQEISNLQDGDDAWNLDKFKFLHILEKTFKMRPGRKWYVFVEADTYLVQSNLLFWLAKMDHTIPLYLGSPTSVNNEVFSHGGSGYILSGKALEMFAKGDDGIARRYDEKMKHEQFGDYMLMKALRDKGVSFSKVWPLLQSEKPSTLPFGKGPDSGVRHWCQPIVTMHHITPNEATRLYQYENGKEDLKKPLLLNELYHTFVSPHLYPIISDWYNLSDDVKYRGPSISRDRQKPDSEQTPIEREAYSSFEACGKACAEQERCYQWIYTDNDQTCGFSYSFRLGYKRLTENGKSFKSGFNLERIKQFEEQTRCEKPEWLFGS